MSYEVEKILLSKKAYELGAITNDFSIPLDDDSATLMAITGFL